MRENCTSGSVRGAPGNGRSYRESYEHEEIGKAANLLLDIYNQSQLSTQIDG